MRTRLAAVILVLVVAAGLFVGLPRQAKATSAPSTKVNSALFCISIPLIGRGFC